MCAYDAFDPSLKDDLQQKCQDFVDNVTTDMPTYLQKQKTHLILHLVECMDEFSQTSCLPYIAACIIHHPNQAHPLTLIVNENWLVY